MNYVYVSVEKVSHIYKCNIDMCGSTVCSVHHMQHSCTMTNRVKPNRIECLCATVWNREKLEKKRIYLFMIVYKNIKTLIVFSVH